MAPLIPTTIVGSYPQPAWLVDPRELLRKGVPRTRADDVWRLHGNDLEDAQDAAALLAIHDQVTAGIDIVTDGEVRRESYFNHFATALSGIAQDRVGEQVNRVGGPLRSSRRERSGRMERPCRAIHCNVPPARHERAREGHRARTVHLEPTRAERALPRPAFAGDGLCRRVRAELLDLSSIGIDVLQLDEPYLQANAEAARGFAVEAIDRALRDVPATTVVHTCYGYAVYVSDKSSGYPFLAELASCAADQISIEYAQPALTPEVLAMLGDKVVVLGVLDLSTNTVEAPSPPSSSALSTSSRQTASSPLPIAA